MARHIVWIVLLSALQFRLLAQTPPPSTESFSQVSGTLNVVLANKSGIVVAADSRATTLDGGRLTRTDSYQRLFRTGSRSALTIAGLLGAGGIDPFRLDTIGRILGRYGRSGMPDERGDPEFVTGWLTGDLGLQVDRLAAVFGTFKALSAFPDLRLIATVAGYDKEDRLAIQQTRFEPASKPLVARGRPVPDIEVVTQNHVISEFNWLAVGVRAIAEAILAGAYEMDAPIYRTYIKATREGSRGDLSLEALEGLVRLIFRETIRHEVGVGGTVQIAVIPSKGLPRFPPSTFLTPEIRLGGGSLVIGAENPFMAREWTHGANFRTSQNFDTLAMTSTFVANEFHDLTIPLDENDYYGNIFRRCTFRYTGKGTVSFANNDVESCALEISAVTKVLPPAVLWLKGKVPTLVEKKGFPSRPLLVTPKWVVQQSGPSR